MSLLKESALESYSQENENSVPKLSQAASIYGDWQETNIRDYFKVNTNINLVASIEENYNRYIQCIIEALS